VPVATGERSISDIFFVPLVMCMVGFGLLFLALVLMRTATEIRARRIKALEARMRG
jgi:heme exporter protein C